MKTNNFKLARIKAGYESQRELAEKLNVANTTIARWESGAAIPPTKYLGRLADAFGISKSELLELLEV